MAKLFMATLVRGSTYVANGTFFRKENPPVQVTKDTKEYLERTAVDELSIPDGNGGTIIQPLQKFTFTEVVSEDDTPKKTRKANAAKSETKVETESDEDNGEGDSEGDEDDGTTEDTPPVDPVPAKPTRSRS